MINREYLQSLSKGTSKNQELLLKILEYAEKEAKEGYNRTEFYVDSYDYTELCVAEVVCILQEQYQLNARYTYSPAQTDNEINVFHIEVSWH